MDGVQLHSLAPTHASIYLGVLCRTSKTLHDKLITNQCFSKCAQFSFYN